MIARLRSSDVARHGALVFGGVAFANLFNYLYYMLAARVGGVVNYGIITTFISLTIVLAAPATVLQSIAARLAADLAARGDRAALRKLSDVVSAATFGTALLVTLAGLIGRSAIAGFFNLTDEMPIVVSALAFPFVALIIAQRGVFQGSRHFGAFSGSLTIDAVVKVIVGIPLILVAGASGGILGYAVSSAVTATYSLILFRVRFGRARAPLALDRRLIVRVVSGVGITQLVFTLLMFYDVPLIKHAFDARSAGLYAAAALIGRALWAAISFVPTLVMPTVTARVAAGDSPRPLLLKALGVSGAIVVVSALAGAFAPRLIIAALSGRAFVAAAPLVLPYVVASGVLAIANVVAAYEMGQHRYGFVAPAAVIAVVEVVVFALWHPTLIAAVSILLTGHAAILITLLVSSQVGVRSAPVPAGA